MKFYSLLALSLVGIVLGFALLAHGPKETVIVAAPGKIIEEVGDKIFKNKDDSPVEVIFVGDIMLSRYIGELMEQEKNWKLPFEPMADFLKSADITFGNLESPISEKGEKLGSKYSFRADPRAVGGLVYAGFDVLSYANNHVWDYGREAFLDTLNILDENNIKVAGAGDNYASAHRPAVEEVNGIKIAFLAYTNLVARSITQEHSKPAVAYLDLEKTKEDIVRAKEIADVVFVSLHWGEEYKTTNNDWQEGVAKELIDAGADAVIGHHPHVVEPHEKYNGGYIFYSLGNFVFDQNFSQETKEGLLVRIMVSKEGVVKAEKIPIAFDNLFRPYVK